MVTETVEVTIYGASDDLVEVEGKIQGAGEYDAGGGWVGALTDPDGESLVIRVEYSKPGARAEWTIAVENTESYPGWPIRFTERPGYEGDPALVVVVPAGTVLTIEVVD